MFSKEKSIERINALIMQINNLKSLPRGNPIFKKWIRDSQVALEYIFGNESRHISDFNQIRYSLSSFSRSTTEHQIQQRYIDGLENAKHILNSMIEEINEYWDEKTEETLTNNQTLYSQDNQQNTNKIFIIHGHDTGIKETVARFISKIGFEPIILHEQANHGRTIIEKFEDHSDVGFAIALLTPDDTGSSIKKSKTIQPRARQNVIFEFGYFIGKLGRNRVAGLIKGDLEIPSDYSGVLYIPIDDAGIWQFLLIKELKSVGYEIDANQAI